MLFVVSGCFLASLAVSLMPSRMGKVPAGALPLVPLLITAYFASQIAGVSGGTPLREETAWFPALGVTLSFTLDAWSLIFALLIAGIGTLVTFYSTGYLSGHPQQNRFFSYLFFFMASMLGTVLASNAILIFIFWELTSLSSYFLIGFDHEDAKSRASALQALLVTGIGGLAMLAGFVLVGNIAGSFELNEWFLQGEVIRSHPTLVPALCLILLGAFTKSAQFPFHFWLPSAMVAPTPVSAYLHSSTMVKAGVYLLARLVPLFGATALWPVILPWTGAITMLAGAFLALRADDMKQHLAYLTVSALGLLVLLIGSGSTLGVQAAVIFLVAHAFYKGSLFMTVGSVHHATGLRDPEKLSGLAKKMPFTAAAAVVAGASLASLPPFLGFGAKELALASAIGSRASWIAASSIAAAGMVYTALFLWIALKPFLGNKPGPHAHEAPFSMWSGAAVLAFLGLAFPLMVPITSPFWEQTASALSGATASLGHAETKGIHPEILLSLASWAGGVILYWKRLKLRAVLNKILEFSRVGPEMLYKRSIESLLLIAKTQTDFFQTGSLRYYFRIVTATAIVLTALGFLRSGFPAVRSIPFYFFETALAVMIIAATFATLFTEKKLAAVAYLGVVGLSISLIFFLFGAPDLAMTQFAVEVLTLILLALVLYRLPHFKKISSRRTVLTDALLAIGSGFMMFLFVLSATYHTPGIFPALVEFYEKNTLKLAHGHNIVNVILVDFRGFDTLGEITVLGIAGIGAYALLKLTIRHKKERP